jgi:hypothetical protein
LEPRRTPAGHPNSPHLFQPEVRRWKLLGCRFQPWARDGSGAVDARAGVTIAQQRRRRDAPATPHGWDVGTLSSSVIGADQLATFRYHVTMPSVLWFPRVNVALAWDSAVPRRVTIRRLRS